MKVKAENGLARILKAEGIPWVSCYPTSNVNNALGEEGVPILMMGEERFAVAVADAIEKFGAGANEAVERTRKEIEQLRREAASSIIVPDRMGGFDPPTGGGLPGGGQIRLR